MLDLEPAAIILYYSRSQPGLHRTLTANKQTKKKFNLSWCFLFFPEIETGDVAQAGLELSISCLSILRAGPEEAAPHLTVSIVVYVLFTFVCVRVGMCPTAC